MKIFFCAVVLWVASLNSAFAADINVFAAASMKEALDEISSAFKVRSGHGVVATYASTGTLAKQIEQLAPADIFIAADESWMDDLATKNLIRIETHFILAGNSLVLIKQKAAKFTVAFDKLADALDQERLAIGDIKSVPAGKYAKAALDATGQWASVETKIAMQENVRAALALVARGEAKLGIVYASDVKAEPKVEIVATFPEDTHPKIVYPVAVVAASTNSDAAGFIAFLKTPEVRAILDKNGFTPIP